MGDIYSAAATVYVWLGSGENNSDRALNFIEYAGFHRYFQWDLESASIEKRQLETRKAAYAYAFGPMGRIRVSSSSAKRKSTKQGLHLSSD
jgi:hypothetical protein